HSAAQLLSPPRHVGWGMGQSIQRFYFNHRAHMRGKKDHQRFQHDSRSVEYKGTGRKLDADKEHLTLTDGCGIGRVRLVGIRVIATIHIEWIEWVRRVSAWMAAGRTPVCRCTSVWIL